MKGKLGIIFGLFCVASFFLYRMGESNRAKMTKETFINGKVIDAVNEKPIQGVRIAVAGNNPKSASDENGDFVVLARNSEELILKHPDYKSTVISAQDAKLVRLEPQTAASEDTLKEQIKKDFPDAEVN